MEISLPWPPSALRPNASQRHWRTKHTAAQFYKSLCMVELRNQGLGKVEADKLHLTIRFCPPDRRRRDIDNLVAQVKYAIDSIAQSTGVDDYNFGLTLLRGAPVKGGTLQITISEESE